MSAGRSRKGKCRWTKFIYGAQALKWKNLRMGGSEDLIDARKWAYYGTWHRTSLRQQRKISKFGRVGFPVQMITSARRGGTLCFFNAEWHSVQNLHHGRDYQRSILENPRGFRIAPSSAVHTISKISKIRKKGSVTQYGLKSRQVFDIITSTFNKVLRSKSDTAYGRAVPYSSKAVSF